jgi:hypothetical protein
MQNRDPYAPPYPTHPEMPVGQPCGDVVYVDIDGIRHVFECGILPPEHANQPHVVALNSVEEGDMIGIYWWHEGE